MNVVKSLRALALSALLISTLAGPCLAQGTFRINFDGPPLQPPATQYIISSYSESGMVFTPLPEDILLRNGGGMAGCPDNGTACLQGGSLMANFIDGSLFGLSSVDLAGYSSLVPDFSMEFIGHFADGGAITNTFSGTGINFRTFYFDPGFTGLSSIEIVASDWTMDNLAGSVPEPSQFALGAVGSCILLARCVRRKSRDL